jgi:hypothetical protein
MQGKVTFPPIMILKISDNFTEVDTDRGKGELFSHDPEAR